MRVCHTLDPVFDDPNLIAFGGLPAVMRLAEHAGLHDLVDEHVTAGANASVKVSAIIAGMVAGADSISDLDVLRHGGMGRVFTGRQEELRDPLGWRLALEDERGVRFAVDVIGSKAGDPVTYATADWSVVGGAPERGVPSSITSRHQ